MMKENYYFRKVSSYKSRGNNKRLCKISKLPIELEGSYVIVVKIPKMKIHTFKQTKYKLIRGKKLVDEIMSNPRKVLDRI